MLVVNGEVLKLASYTVRCHRCSETLTFCADCISQGQERRLYFWLSRSHVEPCHANQGNRTTMKTISITINNLSPAEAASILAQVSPVVVGEAAPKPAAKPAEKPAEKPAATSGKGKTASAAKPKVSEPEPEEDDEDDEDEEEEGDEDADTDDEDGDAAEDTEEDEEEEGDDEEDDEEEAPPARKGPPPPKVDASKVKVPALPKVGAKKASSKDEIPAKVMETRKIPDVVSWLMDDKGMTDVDEIKAKVMSLKDVIPVLQRAGDNLEQRLDRAMEIIDMGDGGEG